MNAIDQKITPVQKIEMDTEGRFISLLIKYKPSIVMKSIC